MKVATTLALLLLIHLNTLTVLGHTTNTEIYLDNKVSRVIDKFRGAKLIKSWQDLFYINTDTYEAVDIKHCGRLPGNIEINKKNEIFCMPEIGVFTQLDPRKNFDSIKNYTCGNVQCNGVMKYFVGKDLSGAFCTNNAVHGSQISLFNSLEKRCFFNFINKYNLQVIIEHDNKLYAIFKDSESSPVSLGYYNKEGNEFKFIATLTQSDYLGMKFFKDTSLLGLLSKSKDRTNQYFEVYNVDSKRFTPPLDVTHTRGVKVFDDYFLVFEQLGTHITKYTIDSSSMQFNKGPTMIFRYPIEPKFKDGDQYVVSQTNDFEESTILYIDFDKFTVVDAEPASYSFFVEPFELKNGSTVNILATGYSLTRAQNGKRFMFLENNIVSTYVEPKNEDVIYSLSVSKNLGVSQCWVTVFQISTSSIEHHFLQQCPMVVGFAKILAIEKDSSSGYNILIEQGTSVHNFQQSKFHFTYSQSFSTSVTAFMNSKEGQATLAYRTNSYQPRLEVQTLDLKSDSVHIAQVLAYENAYKMDDRESILLRSKNQSQTFVFYDMHDLVPSDSTFKIDLSCISNIVPCGPNYAVLSCDHNAYVVDSEGVPTQIKVPNHTITNLISNGGETFTIVQPQNGFGLKTEIDCVAEPVKTSSGTGWFTYVFCFIVGLFGSFFIYRHFSRRGPKFNLGEQEQYYNSKVYELDDKGEKTTETSEIKTTKDDEESA